MSKPQNSLNLDTPADRKAARLTHKHTAIGAKATNPVPAFLQQPAPSNAVESKVCYCQSYGNAHLHRADTPYGAMYRVSGESKFLCRDCIAFRAKALASQNYPSADKAVQS